MKTRTILFAAFLAASLLHAEDGKTYSYHTGRAGVVKQSPQEIEDIGEISEAAGTASALTFDAIATVVCQANG